MSIKTDNKQMPVCIIRADADETKRMLAAMLSRDFPVTDGTEHDVCIAEDGEYFRISRSDGGASLTLPRPLSADTLISAVHRVCYEDAVVDFTSVPETLSAVLGEVSVTLTDTEFRLYSAILENRHSYTSAEDLSRAVWGNFNRNLCTVYISYLRRKLDSAFGEGTLITASGKGYRLRELR